VANPKVIKSSKTIGEPQFFLAASVLFAIEEALIAARADLSQEVVPPRQPHDA
jgi:xanthine dehydrogenase/oxidase